jgi:molybdopterin-containing oxidoreductase family membrane subunit
MNGATDVDTSLLDIGKAGDVAISDKLMPPPRWNRRLFFVSLLVTGFLASLTILGGLYTILTGIGVWGNNIPVAWAFAITNFVFWIGIGHAGTFISAILLLFGVRWRSSINRIAEAMTLFAVLIAALFPLLHLGRAWFFYWLIPYPSTMRVWPQFTSALCWDVMAVFTYFTISLVFWYLGLVPDLAVIRDRATNLFTRRAYGLFALGWRGSQRHWRHYRSAQILLAGLATPLVLSVHSVVSMDFATAILPGWHSTIFPPYFVAGAIFSGFAMVLTIVIPLRKILGYEGYITEHHLDLMAKMMLLTGLLVAYSYAAENFTAWYTGDEAERRLYFDTRPFGPYAFSFWITMICNCGIPQLLWIPWFRKNPIPLFIISVFVNIGMWTERFMLIVSSLNRDHLPSSWHLYIPSLVDGLILLGTFGLFLFLVLVLTRFIPVISITETKELRHELVMEERHHA